MTDIKALCDHRTKLCAMKATLLGSHNSFIRGDAYQLDADIRRVDEHIAAALHKGRPPQFPHHRGCGTRGRK